MVHIGTHKAKTSGVKVSKTITDFFNFGSNKRQHEVQDLAQSETHQTENTQENVTATRPTLSSHSSRECNNLSKTFPAHDSASESKDATGEWYKGTKLESSWILNTYPCLEKVKLGKRSGMKCTTCFKQIQEAKKFSKNGSVPIADRVRMDVHRELERIVDHLHSESHIAAEQLEQMQQRWMLQSEKHLWVKSLKSQNAEKIKILIEMAVNVYNDSRQLTLSANSWPSRSLAKMHTDIQIASYKDNGLDAQFVKLNPSPELLQYRNPVIYREMLDVVSSLTMEKVIKELEKADCFAIQIDGSFMLIISL